MQMTSLIAKLGRRAGNYETWRWNALTDSRHLVGVGVELGGDVMGIGIWEEKSTSQGVEGGEMVVRLSLIQTVF